MALQSSSFSYGWSYDVFLSFRGSDTRHGFAGSLYKALIDKGIRAFIDDELLQRGEEISASLVTSIEESRIAIPVFSPNYASSSFCLDELATIMDCFKRTGRLVLPVFYDVDPSHVRHQRGTYAEAMARHEERFKDEKERVQRWRIALHQAANLSGEHLQPKKEYEYVFVEKIVKVISNKISRVPLHVADYPVGLEPRVLEVNRLLSGGSEDGGGVHMVGIYGVGGVGKSTLARATYNLIADQFRSLCFLENVREQSNKHGLKHLQELLLSKLLRENNFKLTSVNEGISVIKERLRSKNVLLVLDDVDKLGQLQAIVGGPDWFGSGSRVIITTRDSHLLSTWGMERKYEVEGLSEKEAIELLSWNAFKYEKVDPSYIDILSQAATYSCGIPLALEVIGSNLFGRSVEVWISALDQYKRIPHIDIHKILKISFDALDEYQQNFFLDIAFYMKGYSMAQIENILFTCYDVCPKYGIHVLVEKSLIKIEGCGNVTLHDLIQDMGREIIRQESPEEPGKRSRLWLSEDIVQVLEENTGTSQIQIIALDAPICEKVGVEWDGEAFKKMRNLKTLIIRNACFSQCPKWLPNSLRVLEWLDYPSSSLPSDFYPKKLVIFKLSDSRLTSADFIDKRKFMNLTVLQFDHSNIEKIPDVSGARNLLVLSFCGCEKLTTVHESVGLLDKLEILNANWCKKLRNFPPLMLTSLKELKLSWCSSLESFPEILVKMKNIKKIDWKHTPIKELPFSITNLTELESLEIFLEEADGIMLQVPRSICMMPHLESLDFCGLGGLHFPRQDEGEEQAGSLVISSEAERVFLKNCHMRDESFPIFLAMCHNVKELDLTGNDFTVVPESIKLLWSLKALTLDYCEKLREIRGFPPNLSYLSAKNCTSLSPSSRNMLLNEDLLKGGSMKLLLPGSSIPEWFDHISSNNSIAFWFRNKLPVVSLCVACAHPEFHTIQFLTNGFHRELQLNAWCKQLNLSGDHTVIINQVTVEDKKYQLSSEKEWNHVVCKVKSTIPGAIRQTGIYVHKHRSSMDDILFTDPPLHKEEGVQQQNNLASLALLEMGHEMRFPLHLPQSMNSLNDDVNWDSSLIGSMPIISSGNVQGYATASSQRKRSTLMLDLNSETSDTFGQELSKNDLDLDLTLSRLTGNIPIEGASQSSSVIKELLNETEDSFHEAKELRKRKSCTLSSERSSAKIQKTATRQITHIQEQENLLILQTRNHDKDSDVEVVETAFNPTATSMAESMIPENVDPSVNALMEIQPPSPPPLDLLAELERILSGSYDLSSNSASASEIQSADEIVVNILQTLEPLMVNNPLESLTADGEIKQQILDCLSKLGQLDDQIPITLQSTVAQVRDFYEDLIHNFPCAQQTLVEYSCLEEERSKLLENVKQAKVKQAQIDSRVSGEKNQLKELGAEIAELQRKLKTAEGKRNELESAIKDEEAEKTKILEEASGWLLESKQVMQTMASSKDAYKKAQNSKTRFEARLASLRGAFAANKP